MMRTCSVRQTVLLAAAIGWLGGSASGQTPPATSPADEGIREISPAPGGYSYNSAGRRDPFMSLVRRGGPAEKGARKQGMEGLLIQELALRGIIKTPEGYIAFLSGPDGKSYWPRVGQRFFDGQLIAIDATTAAFRQEVSDPLSPVRTRDVKKYLYPTEEATQ
jgi:Tfp pilus assembly protein PilP